MTYYTIKLKLTLKLASLRILRKFSKTSYLLLCITPQNFSKKVSFEIRRSPRFSFINAYIFISVYSYDYSVNLKCRERTVSRLSTYNQVQSKKIVNLDIKELEFDISMFRYFFSLAF